MRSKITIIVLGVLLLGAEALVGQELSGSEAELIRSESELTRSESGLTGPELLDRAIQYHDPQGRWSQFSGELIIDMEVPDRDSRATYLTLDLPNQIFEMRMEEGKKNTEVKIKKDNCNVKVLDNRPDSEKKKNERVMDCDRAKMYKNYYTYLYGLPMKLKDPGTHIADKVERRKFKGTEFLVLKATYDQKVGSDVWYFYFDPTTYAMHVYQFYKTDKSGKMIEDSGEYILLKEEKIIDGIKMPKARAWYYNKNDGFLAVDVLR